MPINVLVVDDSAFFRRRIKEILDKNSDIKVVGFADTGRSAIEKAAELKPDVITMDYEMPLMDGISAVKVIMSENPTPILMFSSLSYEGARVTLDALEAGALDYLPKSFESMSGNPGDSTRELQDRVIALSRKRSVLGRSARTAPEPEQKAPPIKQVPLTNQAVPAAEKNGPVTSKSVTPRQAIAKPVVSTNRVLSTLNGEKPKLILIGASTGGPIALQNMLMMLPANFSIPVLLIQHMPGTFTSAFAERLDRLCKIQVKEAMDNDVIRPGQALLAPGGKQMLVENAGRSISIVDGGDKIQYRPSVDVSFGSAARTVKGKILALVLTGMGHDGREGSKFLKRQGATIWTQNEKSCVVYGMPMAVQQAGLSDASLELEALGAALSELN